MFKQRIFFANKLINYDSNFTKNLNLKCNYREKTLRYKEHNNFFCDTDNFVFSTKWSHRPKENSNISIPLNTTKNFLFIAKLCRDHRC